MLRFQFGAAGHLFGLRYLRCCTGPNVLETGLQVLTWPATKPTLVQVRCRCNAATCAPQPAAFGGNKFVFNLKTFHSSLAFCSLIYGAKRFLFKYHRVKFLHGFPLIFLGVDLIALAPPPPPPPPCSVSCKRHAN